MGFSDIKAGIGDSLEMLFNPNSQGGRQLHGSIERNKDNELVGGAVGALTGGTGAMITSGGNPLATFGGMVVGAGAGVSDSRERQAAKADHREAQNVLNSLTAQQNSLIDPRSFNPQQQATQPTLIG